MKDNSWINDDRKFRGNRVTKLKVSLTIAVLIIATVGTLVLNGFGSNATQYQSEGVIIDFGNYETVWTDISFTVTKDPVELLTIACQETYSTDPIITDGKVTGINKGSQIVTNTSTHTWNLWYVEKGQYDFKKSDDYNIDPSSYTVVAWAYTTAEGSPSIAVDATATSIYGYSQPHRMVTLSPVCTEMVAAMDALSLIKGTDSFSNYPPLIDAGHKNNTIAIVGTYTDPSYESIIHTTPDMVICDGSQYSHKTMAGTLRNSNTNAVVIFEGDDLETVINNIFIVGVAMKYEQRATYVVSELNEALGLIEAAASAIEGSKTLVTLSSNPSPYSAGSSTYIDDIISSVNGTNVLTIPGWPNITSEYISQLNPSCIIVLDYGEYSVDEYNLMLSSLSPEWKKTNAFKNSNIYLYTDGLGEMAQRSGPRIAQLTEIIARTINPDAFTDSIVLPHAIGSDYKQYLTYTKDLGFDD